MPHLKLLLKAKIDFENDFKSAYALLFSIQKAIAATLDLASHIVVNETKNEIDFKKVVDLLPQVIRDLEKFVKEIEKHF